MLPGAHRVEDRGRKPHYNISCVNRARALPPTDHQSTTPRPDTSRTRDPFEYVRPAAAYDPRLVRRVSSSCEWDIFQLVHPTCSAEMVAASRPALRLPRCAAAP